MLTLDWSDGFTFMLLDFTLLSSKKAQINGILKNIDRRRSGYKRRLEALETAPSLIPSMIDQALKVGVPADYQQPLIKSIVEIGLDIIGMIKATNQLYLVNGHSLTLKELYSVATSGSRQKRNYTIHSHNDGQRGGSKGCVCSKS